METSKLFSNFFQTEFEMELQKKKEGPYNQSLKNAIKHLKSIGEINNAKDIVLKTGYHKSTVSEYIRGLVKASPEFEKEFEEKFEISLEEFTSKDENYNLTPKGLNITLRDYLTVKDAHLNDLRDHNHKLFELLNSSLGDISKVQQAIFAMVRTLQQHEAVMTSQGNKKREVEMLTTLSKLNGDNLNVDARQGNGIVLHK